MVVQCVSRYGLQVDRAPVVELVNHNFPEVGRERTDLTDRHKVSRSQTDSRNILQRPGDRGFEWGCQGNSTTLSFLAD
ncbi:hypothetical protein AALO_G00257480 [Alosa alosa]|uniref:Uncharacterized protein n=1 Tax=Alosa alosa TaxID=278164 RepID=A0AAV6FPD8_9TELE|nr:hypothetical protein AALO_G00257480 [Alosa alosa]